MTGRVQWSLWVACVWFGGCTHETPAWCVSGDDIETRSAEAPAWRSQPILTELWEVGGLEEGHEIVSPNAAAIDPTTGVIAVSDVGSTSIIVVGPGGQWRDRWSRSGRGPGEFEFPIAIRWDSASELAVLDAGNSKLMKLTIEGETRAETPINTGFISLLLGRGMMWVTLQGEDVIGMPGPVPDSESGIGRFTIVRGRNLGDVIDTLATRPAPMFSPGELSSIPVLGEATPLAAPLTDSIVAVANEQPAYRIRMLDRSGQTVALICRVVDPVPFSPMEKSGVERYPMPEVTQAIEAAEPASELASMGRLLPDGAGGLWVQRERASLFNSLDRWFGPPGARFDVFGQDGRYLGEVSAPAGVRLAAVQGSKVIGFRIGTFDEISLVGYQLTVEE